VSIIVSRDVEGLQTAAIDLMTESLMQSSEDRKLSPGYYKRVEYLLWLETNIEAGGRFELTADELEGIAALARAKAEFSSEHPACGACGARQYSRFARRCRSCNVEFQGRR
jgi:NADH pyrophosphatase NudC (nudix superfamily)